MVEVIRVLKGDCRDVLKTLPDESVHCCITSPPYWGLRSYGIGTENGELGLEPSFTDYIETMVQVFREVRRVLRKDGTLFLNMGDSYFSGVQRANACDNGGKEPEDSQVRDCFCQNLCDVCREAYRIGKFHSGLSRVSMPAASIAASNREHMESLLGRSPTLGSVCPDAHSEAAILGQQQEIPRAGVQPHTVLSSTNGVFSRLSEVSRSQVSSQGDECRLCGHSLADCVPASVHMKDCTCGTADGALAGRMTGRDASGWAYPSYTTASLKPKDLCGIPWRLAFALQNDGWYLRSDIIWAKPNPMPEPVTDRPTKAHEYLFLLTKSERYYYDAEAIREPVKETMIGRNKFWFPKAGPDRIHGTKEQNIVRYEEMKGANRRTVWEILTSPFPEAHFATFPPALVEPCIKAGTSEKGCCAKCGAPWVREVSVEYVKNRPSAGNDLRSRNEDRLGEARELYGSQGWRGNNLLRDAKTVGFSPSCSCSRVPDSDQESSIWGISVPCTVLDPFGGAGTTGLVADRLGRNAILIELNPQYAEMAKRRLSDDAGLFAQVAAE